MKTKLLCLILALPFVGLAQDVDLKKDGTILLNGKSIGTLEKSKGIVKSYILYDAEGNELVTFEPQGDYDNDLKYVVFFSKSGNKGECSGNFGFDKKIAKNYAKSDLIKEGKYQENREVRFMSAFNGGRYFGGNVIDKPQTQNTRTNGTTAPSGGDEVLLERNRDAMIQVLGDEIKQDLVTIGTVKKEQKATPKGLVSRIKIYNHNGTQIAEAEAVGVNVDYYTVTTLKDNERHNVSVSGTYDAPKRIVTMLIEQYYL